MKSSFVVAFAAGLAVGASALADSEWASAQVGNWSLASNWAPMNVPDLATELATIAVGPGAYTVTLDLGMPAVTTIRGLVLSHPEATLNMVGGRTLSIAGGIFQNDGAVRMNSNGTSSDSVLDFASTTSIVGSGTIRMLGGGDDSRIMSSNGAIVTNESTILGRGEIHAALVNTANGLIAADVSGGNLLVMRTYDKVNAGIMRAQSGAVLTFFGIGVDNTGGLIEADAATVQFTGTGSVTGGSIAAINGGAILLPPSTTTSFTDLSIAGSTNLQGGAEVQLLGTGITNTGTITVNSNGSSTDAVIRAMNSVQISGGGSIVLQGASADSRLETEPGAVLTIGSNQSVVGRGQINAALVNNGLLHANVVNNSMEFRSQDKTNNGTMRASSGGVLNIQGMTVNNSSGQMIADGGTVHFPSGTTSIIGGTISTLNGGSVTMLSGATSNWTNVSLSGSMFMNGGAELNVLGTGLTNNASIIVNNNGSASDAVLRAMVSATINGTGSITLQGFAGDSRIETEPGAVLTIGNNQSVIGRGQINAALVNNGLLHANFNSNSMEFRSENKTNNGTMRATNGGTLNLQNMSLDNTLGAIELDGGTLLFPTGTTSIVGGTIAATNGGSVLFQSGGTSTWTEVEVSGAVNFNGGGVLELAGAGTINNAEIVVNNNGSSTDAVIRAINSTTISGVGSIQLQGNADDSRIETEPGALLTLGSGQAVRGRGQVNGAIINDGLISANMPGGIMQLRGLDKTNHATMQATNSGFLDLHGITLTQSSTGILLADGGAVRFPSGTASVTGGTFATVNAGVVNLFSGATANLSDLTLSGSVTLNGGADLRATGPGIINDALIMVNNNGSANDAHVTIEDGATIGGSGTIWLQGFTADAQLLSTGTGTIGPDQTVIGRGQISEGTINLEGILAPGLGGVGTMDHAANLNLMPSSIFDLEIASTGSHDRLNGTGTVQVGGTLRVSFVSGYTPVKNHAFTFINVGAVSGNFDAIDAPPLTGGLVYRISSTPTTRRLHITCGPDLNLDGVIDFFDVQFFLAAFSAQEKIGDYNGDGIWDFFDVQAFLNAFSIGCP
ncbi:MAG: hypothetical protein KF757_10455 [Phycisphaeraceae bacterium]|nr:hypothetical protein [Phycisphaeraceae bacterium]MCW5764098.1 hypothetical protein [Phycisphaeraceae bacterium]